MSEKLEVPLAPPSLGQEEIEAVSRVLASGWLAHGEENHRFEQEFAAFIGVEHAVSLNSCTSALELALVAAGVKGEVVCPSFTFVATANAVLNAGARPVFAEVDRATRNLTAETIAERLGPRTEAVIVVHYGGQPCVMDPIVDLCRRKGLLLIEDSAETIGARWRGRQAGSFGLGCFSFFPTKNLTTGEGGMFTCREEDLAQRVLALSGHGIFSTTYDREKAGRPWRREARLAGHNYRMPNPLAALGRVQLRRLPEMNARRQALAARYHRLLQPLAQRGLLELPQTAPGAEHVYQMYTVLVDPARRDQVLRFLRQRGVGASVHFDPPVHLQPLYRELGGREGMLPVTEQLSQSLITLPMFPDLTHRQQDWVAACLQEALAA
jgi:perosamine synthetase